MRKKKKLGRHTLHRVEFDPWTELGTVVIKNVTFVVDPKTGLLVGDNSRELAQHPSAELAKRTVIRDYENTVDNFVDPMIRSKGKQHASI